MKHKWAAPIALVLCGFSMALAQFDTGNSTGLPIYPGARVSEHADARGTVSLSDQAEAHSLAANAYLTADKPEKVLDFYRTQLKRMGKVIECTGGTNDTVDVQLDEAAFSNPSACAGDSFAGTELKVVNANEQKIVVVLPHGSGSEIALVKVRGK